jgi:magnesium chelatase accessory protein
MGTRLDWDTDGRDWPHREASQFVTTIALRWHVQVFLHPQQDAPRLLLLHGTGASTHSWRDLIPILQTHYTVVAIDLPAHGFSGMPRSGPSSHWFSLAGMAQAVAQLLKTMEFAPDWVIGHSAGAALAVRMHIDGHLDPLQGVIGLNGALAPLDGLAGQVFSPLAKLLTLAPLVPEVFSWRAATPSVLGRLIDGTGSRLDARGVALYRRLVASPGHVAGALGMMANWDLQTLWRDLPTLRVPLHLVVGANDLIVRPSTARRVAALPGLSAPVTVAELTGLGHLAHEENPSLVVDSIRAFISSAIRS